MSNNMIKSWMILMLIAISQVPIIWGGYYFASYIGWNGFKDEIFFALIDVILSFFGVVLINKFCPALLKTANTKVKSLRAVPFLGFYGVRKIIITSSVFVCFFLCSIAATKIHINITGANKVVFPTTEEYVESGITAIKGDNAWRLAQGKQFTCRLVAAAGEELVFRWFMLRILLGMLSSESLAIIVSSAFFGLFHIIARIDQPTIADITILVLPAVIIGLGLSIQYLRVGLLLSIAFHASANLISAFAKEKLSDYVILIFMLCILAVPVLYLERLIRKVMMRVRS